MILSQPSAQLLAGLSNGAETGTKRIVTSKGLRTPAWTRQDLGRLQSSLLLKKLQLKENIASYCQPLYRGSAF